MYILCGSEGCDSRAVKWAPDIVSKSVKWCEMEIRYSAIRQSVSRVRDRAKVRDRVKRNGETRQSLSSGENFLVFQSRYKSLKYK